MRVSYLKLVFVILHFILTTDGLSKTWKDQIGRNREELVKIKEHILKKEGKHNAYNRLAEFSDSFGLRLAGSKSLEDSIDFILKDLKENDKIENVQTEVVKMPIWKPPTCSTVLKSQIPRVIKCVALGGSTGISQEITSEFIVVKSFEELEKKKDEIKGKIVVYNQPWVTYGTSVAYRSNGAKRAAALGALASLTRSVTQFSLYSIHTGNQNEKNIPALSITVEDAEFLQRLYNKNSNTEITITLKEGVGDFKDESRNLIAEIPGEVYPEQVVIFGAHIDTWNLADGAMDDGAAVFIGLEALRVIKILGKKPLRTIRLVLWTSEENGIIGGQDYYNKHKAEAGNVSLIIESDHGVFKPRGIQFTGTNLSKSILQETLNTYLKDVEMTEIIPDGTSSDTSFWIKNHQVPGVELNAESEKYFYFHHTEADTMTVLDPDHLDSATLLWATIIYSVANFDVILPRNNIDSDSGSNSFALTFNILTASLVFSFFLIRKNNFM